MDALQDLTNIEEQPKSLIVHQQEPMTQNKRTHLHFSWNRKLLKTDVFTHSEDFCIVTTSLLSQLCKTASQFFVITGHSAIALTPQFDRNETHG